MQIHGVSDVNINIVNSLLKKIEFIVMFQDNLASIYFCIYFVKILICFKFYVLGLYLYPFSLFVTIGNLL